jgi:acetolactate synthase-1/2/3 large subunit
MGFGLPAAIGAAYEFQDKKVICFSGDGSFLMNIQELATLKELDLDVKVIIFNNVSLGMVRQQQELFYNENYMASKYEFNPNFKQIAEGFGVKGISISQEESNLNLLNQALEEKGPCVIEIMIKQEANVYPMVPPGSGNIDMIGGEKYE